jgi:O-antigen ligase
MITTRQPVRKDNLGQVKDASQPVEALQSSLASRAIMLWLLGTVIFLPVKIINLPYNFELVDLWILMGLPVVFLFFFVRPRQKISLAYLFPMWLVMVSSFLSSFAAPSAKNSLMVIIKEGYLFVWFLSLSALLYIIKTRDLRLVLRVWSILLALHGLLMIAQFLSPEIWRLTNSLGGNSARVEGYRAAGLFICDKAGCANKAAYYQLLGFVPILLAGFGKRTTILLGTIVFISMLTTGSMAATLAFLAGLIAVLTSIAFFKKKLFLVIKYVIRLVFAILLLGGLFLIVANLNQTYRNHFEKIIVGRFERSSGGRLNLWQRGIDALLEHNAFFWGVGPENFRVVDAAETDNQLHNDTLAFLVERGLIGVLGLALFAGIAIRRAISIIELSGKAPGRARLELVVFLAVIAATMVESLTHQMFRTRELWLVLAIQEAVYFQMKTSAVREKPTRPSLFLPQNDLRPVAVPSKSSSEG